MNHIYRLVWNDITRAWMTVAEIAKGCGKCSSAAMEQSPCHQRRLSQGSLASLCGRQILAVSLALIGGNASAFDTSALASSTSSDSKATDKPEEKPAAKPVVTTVVIVNTTVQKPAEQVVQVDRPKGRLLVCKAG